MNPELERLIKFSESFDYKHDNDREIVIVGCAYIESLIKDILEATFIDDHKEVKQLLSDSTGSLSSLVPRSRLLYLLGVIPELVYKDILTIGKIRNLFAHNVSMSFDDNAVCQLCRNLKWHIQSMMMKPPAGATTRDIYQVGVNQVVCHLGALPGLQRLNRDQGN
ncbi:MAG: MltR family transcriptional regulator [Methylococcaceae bacterium]